MIGTIGFLFPWLLLTLVALPILWIILRAVPPAPILRIFPGVTLLLGLKDEEQTSDRTPWWLLLLRMIALAALIIGLAGPVLNPHSDEIGRGPVLIVMDASWASAPDWSSRIALLDRVLDDAARADRTAALLSLSAPEQMTFQAATEVQSNIAGLAPQAWAPNINTETLATLLPEQGFDTIWVSDELNRETRDDFATLFSKKGALRVFAPEREAIALAPAQFEGGATLLEARRSVAGLTRSVQVEVHGTDPSGAARILASADITFDRRCEDRCSGHFAPRRAARAHHAFRDFRCAFRWCGHLV